MARDGTSPRSADGSPIRPAIVPTMTIPRRAAEAAMKKDDAPRSQPLTPANDNDADPRAAKVDAALTRIAEAIGRSEEHTSELQSLMRISYAVFCLKKKKNKTTKQFRMNK